MPRGDKAHGSNWLIQHHARSFLPIIGLSSVRSCKALHPRITLPQAIPDGLFEVELADRTRIPLLMEVETYPSAEHAQQLAQDLEMARAALGRLPDAVLVVLTQRGAVPSPDRATQTSALGWSSRTHGWRVVEMWRVPAEQLMDSGDVGQMPLPLTRSDLPAESLVELARQRIEEHAPAREQATLLTITAIMAAQRFQRGEEWLRILGGKNVLKDSTMYQMWTEEKERETKQNDILLFLESRFKSVPEELAAEVRVVTDLEKLDRAIKLAARCASLASFKTRWKRA